MALPTGFWGIDIGQCGLKALRLELIDGKPHATAFDYIEHPKILSQPDADPDQLTREALEKFLSRNSLKGDHVAVAVAGQSGLARFVKLPPVEEKKIGDIVKFEAKQQIPFPLEEVVWDYQKIAGGEVAGGFAMETEIGLFAMKRDNIARAMAHFNGVGVDVHYVQMAPLALCNYATYELLGKGGSDGSTEPGAPVAEGEADETPKGKKRCAVIMDIGTDASNLIITDGGKIIWQRPIPLGGNNFTRALTKEMKLTFAKAEHLKRNAAKSPDLPQILRALRPVLTDFVGEVQRSLGYFTNTHRDAHVAYMVGLGNAFKLPGLQKYLAEKLSLDVRKPEAAVRLDGDQVLNDPVFTENVLTFPIAYGLALQGVGLARIQTNLLPPEIRTERKIREKKPWAAAAAAALLLGTGALTGAYAIQHGKVTDSTIESAMKKAKSQVDAADAQEKDRVAKDGELKNTITAVKSIIAGQDERLNWVRLNEVIAAALPRPGETGNLNDPDQQPYWMGLDQRNAINKMMDRLRQGLPADRAWDDDLTPDLPTVNVEAVYTRYTDDLKGFLEKADRNVREIYGNNIAEYMPATEVEKDETTGKPKPKLGEGVTAGWVVEIRGYTFHHQATTGFLDRCLLRNFNKVNKFAADTENFPGTKKSKVGEYIPGMADPVKGNVSHAFFYLKQRSKTADPRTFTYINASILDTLLGGGGMAGGGGMGGPGGPPAGMVPGRGGGLMAGIPGMGGPGAGPGGTGSPDGSDTGGGAGGVAMTVSPFSAWMPITAGAGAGQGIGMGMGGLAGMGEGGPSGGTGGGGPGAPPPRMMLGGPPAGIVPGGPPAGIGGPGGTGSPDGGGTGSPDGFDMGAPGAGIPGTGAAGTQPNNAGRKRPKLRTEFVLMFIWREPTPSDPTPAASTETIPAP